MNRKTALQEFANELHISHSQIFTYLNCSLKYRFQYVEHRPPKRISIALPFGSAIHSAIEMYYRSLKNNDKAEPLEAIIGRFEDCLSLDLDRTNVPVTFKRDMPDRASAIAMGKAILKAFYETVDLFLPCILLLYPDVFERTKLPDIYFRTFPLLLSF